MHSIITNTFIYSFAALTSFASTDNDSLRWHVRQNNTAVQIQFQTLSDDTLTLHGAYYMLYNSSPLLQGYYAYGQRTGDWVKYYQANRISIQAHYLNGKKHGSWKYYHPNGKLASVMHFAQDEKQGTWKSFYRNGNLCSERIFRNDTLLQETNYYTNGQIQEKNAFTCINGHTILEKELFYPSGIPYTFQNFFNGKLHGEYKKFHQNGVLWEHFVYDNGLLMEVSANQNSFDQAMATGNFQNGTGTLNRYHANGKRYATENFQQGKLMGEAVYYRKTGERHLAGQYADNERIGNWKHYKRSLQVKTEIDYYYDSSGVWSFVSDYVTNNKRFDREEGFYLNNRKHGVWNTYNMYNEAIVQTTYHHGLRHGSFYSNIFPNEESGEFLFGIPAGNWEYYFNRKHKYTEFHRESIYVNTDLIFEENPGPIAPLPEQQDAYTYKPFESKAVFRYGTEAEMNFMHKYLPVADTLDYMLHPSPIVFRLEIDELGVIAACNLVIGTGEAADNLAADFFSGMPAFEPALDRNFPVADSQLRTLTYPYDFGMRTKELEHIIALYNIKRAMYYFAMALPGWWY